MYQWGMGSGEQHRLFFSNPFWLDCGLRSHLLCGTIRISVDDLTFAQKDSSQETIVSLTGYVHS